MKMGISEDMDVAEEMAWLVLGSRMQSNILKHYLQLIVAGNGNWHEEEGGNLTLLDYELRVVKDYDGNQHEGGDGCC